MIASREFRAVIEYNDCSPGQERVQASAISCLNPMHTMGRRTAAFALRGFAPLAPSIYVQDSQVGVRNNDLNPESSPSFSQSSFYLPPGPAAESSRRSRDTPPPDLIVLTSWTGAASKHVAKYTASYNALYPGVPILVITTVVSDLVIHSTRHKLKALAPAIDYLLSQKLFCAPQGSAAAWTPSPIPFQDPSSLYSTPASDTNNSPYTSSPNPCCHNSHTPPSTSSSTTLRHKVQQRFTSILLHAFSEGGAHKAVLLAQAYLAATGHAARLPLRALILDSAPGRANDYRRATRAISRALPASPLGRPLIIAAGVVGLVWASRSLGLGGAGGGGGGEEGSAKRGVTFVEETRRALNDERLWDVKRIVRTYLFSEGDEVVWWRDVHDHGIESAMAGGSGTGMGGEKQGGGRGLGSLMVRFKRTEHCAHAKGEVNGALYWTAVRATWEATMDGGMGLRLGLGRRLSLDSLYCADDD
ncbi:uncharacterized protein B0T15DRAFT_534103 [Chaetomium strumarium]|uniref:DUF829-domain-containing protein n=1 Tax=Chaetomium strumarium TaxID=1170767 RepID=A0AAJ0GTY1_9PEZI|nr:hypothetical protein B0T15DRAFT_534103 [Chaetomium strumarium]